MSTLLAQRFRGDSILESCAVGDYRMLAGDPNTESVRKIQKALSDLGYPLGAGGTDGVFGTGTGTAVKQYKTDEALSPTDAVVGPQTTNKLDGYYALESATPDDPDPTTTGLGELARSAAGDGSVLMLAARAALNHWLDADAPSGDPVATLLDRDFRAGASGLGRVGAVIEVVRPNLSAALQAIDLIEVSPLGRDDYRRRFPGEDYMPARFADGTLFVTPGFRNALTDEERTAVLVRTALAVADAQSTTAGYPGTGHYQKLLPDVALRNRIAYMAFCTELDDPLQVSTLHPTPRWPIEG
jgi:hypothetical protein